MVKLGLWLLRASGWYSSYWGYWRTMFPYAQEQGLHVLPVHYYSPVPDTRELPAGGEFPLDAPMGFDLNIELAFDRLDRFSQKYAIEYNSFSKNPGADAHDYYLDNGAYRSGDAEILYSMVRDLKPRRIVEIGSGYSTLLICRAIRENKKELQGYQCEFVAIEPYPPQILQPPPAEVTRIESRSLQQVPLEVFTSLMEGDLLFIDSTHVVRVGSDVVLEFLTIVPSVAAGVVIHVHDIFIPANYPRWWIDDARLFWNEQYLLSAFLAYNREFEVILPTHALWLTDYARFCKAIPSYEAGPNTPCSFWMRRRR